MELKYTPMINQYLKIKNKYPDTLFYFVYAIFMNYFLMMQKLLLKNFN